MFCPQKGESMDKPSESLRTIRGLLTVWHVCKKTFLKVKIVSVFRPAVVKGLKITKCPVWFESPTVLLSELLRLLAMSWTLWSSGEIRASTGRYTLTNNSRWYSVQCVLHTLTNNSQWYSVQFALHSIYTHYAIIVALIFCTVCGVLHSIGNNSRWYSVQCIMVYFYQ